MQFSLSRHCFFLTMFFFFSQPSLLMAAPLQPRAPHPHQRVYLLRGFMNVFSLGMDQLADELRRRGIDAVVANHTLSVVYANEAIRDCRAGLINSIAIVGHSLGATAGIGMADQIGQAGLKVGLVVTIDPINPTAAPGNVKALKNFYDSDGVGKTVQGGQGFHGSVQNIDVKRDPGTGHVAIANSALVHQQVLRYIAAAAGSRCQ
jgi:pimeloyl-ACP methyl ester carboxylesterase